MLSCVINNCLCTDDKTSSWSIEMLCMMRLYAGSHDSLYMTKHTYADARLDIRVVDRVEAIQRDGNGASLYQLSREVRRRTRLKTGGCAWWVLPRG
jgi:hypothetical protein